MVHLCVLTCFIVTPGHWNNDDLCTGTYAVHEMKSKKQCVALCPTKYEERLATLRSYGYKIAGGHWKCEAF